MARRYEAVYIFDSTLEEAAINDRLTRFHELVGATGDVEVDHWGRRQLAYPIGTRENGYYVVARFDAGAEGLPEYERALKLDEGVVRYLVTLHEHELGAPPSAEGDEAEAGARRGDDDDDEE